MLRDELAILQERTIESLLLAYSPEEKLARNFYIPSTGNCEEAYGYSLRKMFGEKSGNSHWSDRVKWNRIKNLNQLEPRILQGTQEIIISEADYASVFESQILLDERHLYSNWFFGKGDLYKFQDGKRETALDDFEKFWSEEEKTQWKEIHQNMRDYTREEFRKKNG